MIDQGKEKGVIEEGEKELLNNVFEFGDITVSEIMTHRRDIFAVDIHTSAEELLQEISEEDYEKYVLYLRETAREDKTLIEVVEELGKEASGMCGELKIVKIPDNAFFIIDSYDGLETLYYSKSEILEK